MTCRRAVERSRGRPRTLTGRRRRFLCTARRDDIVRSDLVMRIVDAYEGAGEAPPGR